MTDIPSQKLFVEEVDVDEYNRIIPRPYVVFNSTRFTQTVVSKCDQVKYLIFGNNRPRLGIILGVRDGEFFSPFSAPFGGFSQVSEPTRIQDILDASQVLREYVENSPYAGIRITLPPTIYDESFISKQSSALLNAGFDLKTVDLNSAFTLKDFGADYLDRIAYSAKKNYKTGVKNNLEFHIANNDVERLKCYSIIKENRESKGRTVKMSYEEVIQTSQVLPADFFYVTYENETVASAIVFTINSLIAQVIYWGAHPNFNWLRPTNYLSYNIWGFYHTKGFEIVDIGPSSQNGVPDCGLLEFKETIGCRLSMKTSFHWSK
ncbi:MAG TPA: hypothetical protein VHO90_15020, partial [Bacteroidales bacterium]|nr:hypothetical protein [Bacteroidales bacterium]